MRKWAILPFAMLVAMSGYIPSAQGAVKTLRWWAPADYVWKQMENKFEAENPRVDIQQVTGDMDKFYNMIISGIMPDIWGPWDSPGIMADVTRNWAYELDSFIKRDAKEISLSDFMPGALGKYRVNGRQYSLPSFGYADYYFYNTSLYAGAGLAPPPTDANDKSWTWEKMINNAKKMTKRIASTGRLQQSGVTIQTELTHSPTWLHIWGAEIYGKTALKTPVPDRAYFNTPDMVKALTMAWELIYTHRVGSTAYNDFTENKSGASIQWGFMIKNFSKAPKLRFAIAPLPWGETNSGVLWPDGWRISRVCKNKELAWKFIKFLTSPKNLQIQVTDPKSGYLGTPPGRKSVLTQTWCKEISERTGMSQADVYKVHSQADEVGILNEVNSICLHRDLCPRNIDPIMADLFANKISPKEAAVKMQSAADKSLPILSKRWLRDQEQSKKKR